APATVRSEGGAELPGGELVLAVAVGLALRPGPGGDRQHQLEDPLAHLLDAGGAVDYLAAVDVHVLGHLLVHRRVGGELDARHRLAAEARAAPGGEGDEIRPGCDLAGGGDRI